MVGSWPSNGELYAALHIPANATVKMTISGTMVHQGGNLNGADVAFSIGIEDVNSSYTDSFNRGFHMPSGEETYEFADTSTSPPNYRPDEAMEATIPRDLLVSVDPFLHQSLASVEWKLEMKVLFLDGNTPLEDEYLGCDSALGVPDTAAPGGDPVNTASGNFYDRHVDLAAPAGTYGMEWSRTYNSQDRGVAAFVARLLGPGWTSSLDASLVVGVNGLEYRAPDGRHIHFPEVAGSPDSWTVPDELYASVSTGSGTRSLTFDSGEVWVFDDDGWLLSMTAPWGDSVTINRDTTTHVPETVVSSTPGGEGYTTTFTDSGDDGLIDGVEGPDGAKVDYTYMDGVLKSASEPYRGSDQHGVEHYEYEDGVLTEINTEVAPNGGTPTLVTRVHNVYDDFGRVETQTGPGGNVTTFAYGQFDGTKRAVIVTHEAPTPTAGDTEDETVTLFYDGGGDLVDIDDPFSQAATWEWRNDQLESFTDPDGALVDPTFDAAGRLEALALPDPALAETTSGQFETTYCGGTGSGDPRVLTETDPTGVVTAYRYGNDSGDPCVSGEFVPSSVVTAPGTPDESTLTVVSTDGLVDSVTDDDGVATTFVWDPGRRLLLAETVDDDTAQVGDQTSFYGYDGAGRLSVVRTPLGNETWTTYDGAGRIRSVVGPVHVETRDCSTLPCAFGSTPPSGPETSYEYWLDGTLKSVTEPGANLGDAPVTTDYERVYNAGGGWVDTQTQPSDGDGTDRDVIEFEYDGAGNLRFERVGDPTEGLAETEYRYNAFGRRSLEISAEGVQTHFHYDNTGRVVGRTIGDTADAEGHTWTTDYDLRGRVTDEVGPSGDTAPDGTTPVQSHTHYDYDPAGRVTLITEGDSPGGGDDLVDVERTWRRYDQAGRLQYEVRDLDGDGVAPDQTVSGTDPQWDPAQWDPEDEIVGYAYTGAGRLESITRPPPDVTTYEWGTITAEIQSVTVTPDGGDPVGGSFTIEWDGAQSDALDPDATVVEVQAALDGLGLASGDVVVSGSPGSYVLTWRDSLGDVLEPIVHDSLTQGSVTLTTTTQGLAPVVTVYHHDDAGQLDRVTPPQGPDRHIHYDDDGRVESTTTPGGAVTSYTYDAAGRVLQTATPSPTGTGTSVATSTYTERGQLATSTEPHDPNATTVHPVVYDYFPDGNLRAVRDARYEESTFEQAEVTYTYDGRSNRTSRATSAQNDPAASYHTVTEHWAYNLDNQLTEARRPSQSVGSGTRYEYDEEFGRLATITFPSGRTEERVYWNSGQVAVTAYTEGTEVVEVEQWFDDHGQRTQMTDHTGDTTYTWDRAGRVAGFAQPGTHNDSYSYGYTYDLSGRALNLVHQPGDERRELTLANEHDQHGQLEQTQVYVSQIPGWWPVARYAYDDDGNQIFEIVNNTAGTRRWEYPDNGSPQPEGYRQDLTTGGDIESDLTWYHDGRRHTESLTTNPGTTGEVTYNATYGYDRAGQLVTATGDAGDHTYTYDARGHRLSKTVGSAVTEYTYDDDGRLLEADPSAGPTLTYGYDGGSGPSDGRRTVVSDGSDTDITTYDPRGLPVMIEREIGPDATTARTYDGDGRLTAVDFDDLDYDLAWDPTQAVPQILETYVDDNLWARFVSGDERVGYELVVDINPTTTTTTTTVGFGLYGYNVDGSVIATDSSVTTAGGYDPFGNPFAPPAASFWLGYRGEAHLDGLIHLRHRDYDPATGTFTTVDPLDGTPGTPTETNPYHYAGNDPVNRIDPLGLSPCSRWPTTVLGFHIGTWACNNIDDAIGIGVGVGCGLAVTVGSGFTAAVVSGAVGGACAGAAQQIVNNLKTPGTGVLDDVFSTDRLVDAAIGGAAGGLTYGAARGLGRLAGTGGISDDIARGSGVGDDITGGIGDDIARSGDDIGRSGDDLAGACHSFAADTPVLMADGTRKPISEVEAGEHVLATNPETGETGAREVLATMPHTDQLLTLRTSSGEIVTTEDHKYWNQTDQAWQESQDLDPGDRLLSADGEGVTVEGLDWTSTHTTSAFDLDVADLDSFYVGDGEESVLVHNCGVDDILSGLGRGRQPHVRTVGSDAQLQSVFDELTEGATPISGRSYDGVWMLRSDGVEVGLRNASRTGGRTIDIVRPDGTRTVVHIE